MLGLLINATYGVVPKGDETKFLLSKIEILQNNEDMLQTVYNMYKNMNSEMKLCRMVSGNIRLFSDNEALATFKDIKSAKIAYVLVFEVVLHLEGKLKDRYESDLALLLKLFFIKD